jgi:hypothetical protein
MRTRAREKSGIARELAVRKQPFAGKHWLALVDPGDIRPHAFDAGKPSLPAEAA